MAVCSWCESEMTRAQTCTVTAFHVDGAPIPLAPFRGWRGRSGGDDRCGSCGVGPGGWHHPGCDLQRCPLCHGQLCSCGCRFDEDGPEEWGDEFMPYGVDANGVLTEITRTDGLEVVLHFADIPASDVTEVRGIPVTTPLRTVIDLAPEVETDRLVAMVEDCLERRLFSVEEAWRRLAEPDMAVHRGAPLLRNVLVARP